MVETMFHSLVQDFCHQMDIPPVDPDENGYYSFVLHGQIEVNVEFDEERRNVLLFSSPGSIEAGVSKALLKEFLEENLYRTEHQPCMALVEEMVMLVTEFSVEVADSERLNDKLGGICDAWIYWQQRMEASEQEVEPKSHLYIPPLEENSLAQFLRYRV
ncbi:Type III secretion system chaperone [Sulfidibacter corallicola]|uniref:Type III secretion system chaperone n=1 Tax=Sulfidibacter corallicola TaxID=2818388 RepID=A0A8A4TXZ9_SULCO|nr:type III secretion system chaperone [Sulfidibacter corallicola]QTD51405.1 type III secretion system chaperone [Sulfidibacter corallicola]